MGREAKASSALNRPRVGSPGVVTTFRTSIVPFSASATRSVKVPPTSTPTLTTAPPPSSTPLPMLHRQDAGEPQGGEHTQRPHPVPQSHVQRDHVAGPQRARHARFLLQTSLRVAVPQRIDELAAGVLRRVGYAHARFGG